MQYQSEVKNPAYAPAVHELDKWIAETAAADPPRGGFRFPPALLSQHSPFRQVAAGLAQCSCHNGLYWAITGVNGPSRSNRVRRMPAAGGVMLWVYVPRGTSLDRIAVTSDADVPDNAIWFDLVNPDQQEDKIVERKIGVAVPTREEMQEIEVTSRLYVENGARYMTATLMCQSDTDTPKTTPVTFILSGHRLDHRPLRRAASVHDRRQQARPGLPGRGERRIRPDGPARRGDRSRRRHPGAHRRRGRSGLPRHFRAGGASSKRSHQTILKVIGRKGDLTSKVRESLVSIGRLLLYLANEADSESMRWAKETRSQLRGMQRDVQSLSDHATYLSNKITFLLDAMLGVVFIEQNNIIKIFSIAAVVLMPPTLVASIYGMNFKHMPELDWTLGYPLAILLMLVAAALPYFIFKWKKWL